MKSTPILILSAICFGFASTAFSQQIATGTADYYADRLHGKPTASGELYDRSKMTAAHLNLPFGTMVRATDQRTGRFVDVRINDRSTDFNRVIVLSRAAAEHLGVIGKLRDRISIQKLANGSQASLTTNYSTGGNQVAAPPIPDNYQFSHAPAIQKPAKVGGKPDAHHQPGSTLFPSDCPRCLAEQTAIEKRSGTRVVSHTPVAPATGLVNPYTQQYSTNTASGNADSSDFYEPFASTSQPAPQAAAPAPAPAAKAPPAQVYTPAPAAQTPPAAVAHSGYRVQFGAFRSNANARRLVNKLSKSGVETEVAPKDRHGNFRVVTAGGFTAQSEAKSWISQFRNTGLTTESPIVVR